MRPSPQLEAFAQSFDDWVVAAMAAKSEQIWKKAYSAEELAKGYKPFLKVHEKYAPSCRLKVPLQGSKATRIWDTGSRKRLETAEDVDWLASECVPRAFPKHVWWQGPHQWGVVWEATDEAVSQASQEFPFDE